MDINWLDELLFIKFLLIIVEISKFIVNDIYCPLFPNCVFVNDFKEDYFNDDKKYYVNVENNIEHSDYIILARNIFQIPCYFIPNEYCQNIPIIVKKNIVEEIIKYSANELCTCPFYTLYWTFLNYKKHWRKTYIKKKYILHFQNNKNFNEFIVDSFKQSEYSIIQFSPETLNLMNIEYAKNTFEIVLNSL